MPQLNHKPGLTPRHGLRARLVTGSKWLSGDSLAVTCVQVLGGSRCCDGGLRHFSHHRCSFLTAAWRPLTLQGSFLPSPVGVSSTIDRKPKPQAVIPLLQIDHCVAKASHSFILRYSPNLQKSLLSRSAPRSSDADKKRPQATTSAWDYHVAYGELEKPLSSRPFTKVQQRNTSLRLSTFLSCAP